VFCKGVAADENTQTTSQQATITHIISLARNAMDLGKQHSVASCFAFSYQEMLKPYSVLLRHSPLQHVIAYFPILRLRLIFPHPSPQWENHKKPTEALISYSDRKIQNVEEHTMATYDIDCVGEIDIKFSWEGAVLCCLGFSLVGWLVAFFFSENKISRAFKWCGCWYKCWNFPPKQASVFHTTSLARNTSPKSGQRAKQEKKKNKTIPIPNTYLESCSSPWTLCATR